MVIFFCFFNSVTQPFNLILLFSLYKVCLFYFLTLKKDKVETWACNPSYNPDRASEYYEDIKESNQIPVLFPPPPLFVSAQTNSYYSDRINNE